MNLEHWLPAGAKGVFYGRYSTKKQDIKTQQESAIDLAKQYGCTIIKEYIDRGVSAVSIPKEKREQLMELLKSVERKEFDFIIIYKPDRLARDPAEHQEIRKWMEKHNMPVIVSSTNELYNKGELLSVALRDGLTKMEADLIRERTRDTYETKIEKGIWMGGTPPFGYRYNKDQGKIENIASEQIVVRDMFRLYKEGYGFHSIAQQINREYHTNKWKKEKIKSIILNPFYAGYLTSGRNKKGSGCSVRLKDDWKVGYCDLISPLMTWEEWEYCWKLYQEKRESPVNPKRYNTPFLLKDILYCGECDIPFQCKNQQTKGEKYGNRIYVCKGCRRKYEYSEVHEAVFNHIIPAIQSSIATHSKQSIFEELKQKEKEEIIVIKNDIRSLEKEILKYERRVKKLDQEISKTYEKEKKKDEMDKELVGALLMYRLSKIKKIEEAQFQILQKKKQIEQLEGMDLDYQYWIEEVEHVIKHHTSANPVLIRKLFLSFFDKITLDKSNKFHYEVKLNMRINSHLLTSSL